MGLYQFTIILAALLEIASATNGLPVPAQGRFLDIPLSASRRKHCPLIAKLAPLELPPTPSLAGHRRPESVEVQLWEHEINQPLSPPPERERVAEVLDFGPAVAIAHGHDSEPAKASLPKTPSMEAAKDAGGSGRWLEVEKVIKLAHQFAEVFFVFEFKETHRGQYYVPYDQDALMKQKDIDREEHTLQNAVDQCAEYGIQSSSSGRISWQSFQVLVLPSTYRCIIYRQPIKDQTYQYEWRKDPRNKLIASYLYSYNGTQSMGEAMASSADEEWNCGDQKCGCSIM